MNYQCYADNCVANPGGYCLCSGVPILFCIVHSHAHTMSNRYHRIYDILVNPLSETQKNLLKISHLKNSLNNTKKSILTKSFEVLKLVENLIRITHNHINKLIEDSDEVILRAALQDENSQMINQDSMFSRLASDEMQIKLKDWNDKMNQNYGHLQKLFKETLDISNLCENQIKLLRRLKQLNAYNRDLQTTQINEINSLPEDHDSLTNEIIFFKDESKLLKAINLDFFEIQIKELSNLPENIQSGIGICELPNKSKFCYGNTENGLTFIIDQDQNVIILPEGKRNYELDLKYYNNFVYAIGGGNKLAERYNLLENKWESCAIIPYYYGFGASRSALFRDQLVIVGFWFGKAICYNINQNKYQEFPGMYLVDHCHKFAFTGGNRVYVGERKMCVYESGENDLTKWTCISLTNPFDENQISYYSLIDETVFFLNSRYVLYEFKFRSKEMKSIKI